MTLKQMFKRVFVCKISQHSYTSSASCPFTNRTYFYCGECGYRDARPTPAN